ncbi:hypothetical protein [Terrisporobacter glycolicus]|nr:hypothetical protein SAMN02910355_3616 [Terrisporobacter glycolicus]
MESLNKSVNKVHYAEMITFNFRSITNTGVAYVFDLICNYMKLSEYNR